MYCPPKPSSQFVLQPSSSSAFCSLNKFSASTMKSSSSSQLFHVNSSNGSGGGGNFIHGLSLGEFSDRSSSVPPQWPVQQQQQISSTVQMIPATPSGQPIWFRFLKIVVCVCPRVCVKKRRKRVNDRRLCWPYSYFYCWNPIPLLHLKKGKEKR